MAQHSVHMTAPVRVLPLSQKVSQHMLVEMSHSPENKSFRVTEPRLSMNDTAINGRFNNVDCPSGIRVHATDTIEAHDLNVQWDMSSVLTVAIFLEGSLTAWLDKKPVQLGQPGATCGTIWSLNQPTRVRRTSQKGMHVRKVIVSVPLEWIKLLFKDHDLPNRNLSDFIDTHCAVMEWKPSKRAVSLAEQILSPPDAPTPIQNMSIESKAIEIIREALAFILTPITSAAAPIRRIKGQARAQRIRQYLQDNLAKKPTLQMMALEFGMSVGSMQDDFKKTYKTTIADFSRNLRLHQARAALEQDGVNVSEAAYLAGYANPASFSTAFKRLFGFPPSASKE